MSFVHASSSFVRLVTSLREADFLNCVSSAKKLMIYKVFSYAIGERCSGQDEENGPQY